MKSAWRIVPVCALAFVGAWFVGHYSGDAGNDFTYSRVLTVRIAPSIVALPRETEREAMLRALRHPRPPVIVKVKKR